MAELQLLDPDVCAHCESSVGVPEGLASGERLDVGMGIAGDVGIGIAGDVPIWDEGTGGGGFDGGRLFLLGSTSVNSDMYSSS